MKSITVVGLGPGDIGYITLQTMEYLQSAQCLLLRTAKHPTVEKLSAKGITFESYDYLYETKSSFMEIYQNIAQDCINKALAGQDIVYAVPGSPFVAEKSVVLLRELAQEKDIELTILPGMSFLEVLYVRLGVDPIEGLTVLDASDIDSLESNEKALVITQVYNQIVASDAKLSLMERLPDDYPVVLVRNLGLKDEEINTIKLYELDRQPNIDHLTSVFVPAQKSQVKTFALEPLIDVMSKLRSPGGCIWDIEQTHTSLRRYIVEEVYEVLEAIELEDEGALCEELGDLLLQIVFHARIAEEAGLFSMQDVIDSVTEKMIRRHPHVFGDISVKNAAEIVINWEKIKKQEKAERKSVLDGVSAGAPSLLRAYKLQAKASKVGFDWTEIDSVWEKVAEELQELKQAVQEGQAGHIEEELGDVLFAVVNLARFLKVDAEVALHRTNNKFIRRFEYIEHQVKSHNLKWENLTLKQLDDLWNKAKTFEN